LKGVLENRDDQTDAFVRKICFQRPQPEDYLKRVIDASKAVPTNTAVALLVGYFAADYRDVLPKMDKPTLIIAAKSPYQAQVVNAAADIPNSRVEIMDNVGHALFVDDPDKFNSLLAGFILHGVIQGKPLQEQQ
jgi:non-heme chloroperoxidase